MKARIDFVCKPANEASEYELESIFLIVDLPFVPSVGLMLKLTDEGDYIQVIDVMFDLTPGGDGLTVGLKEPDEDFQLRSWPEMKAQGWQLG